MQVDQQGTVITNRIRHSHRSKRQVSWRKSPPLDQNDHPPMEEYVEPESKEIHYMLSAYGKNFHLNLTQNTDFLASNFVVEYWDQNKASDIDIGALTNCHYTGRLKNTPNSRVAISNCVGLVSVYFDRTS